MDEEQRAKIKDQIKNAKTVKELPKPLQDVMMACWLVLKLEPDMDERVARTFRSPMEALAILSVMKRFKMIGVRGDRLVALDFEPNT